MAGGTADYVAPELLGDCSAAHSVCLEYCRRVNTAIVGVARTNAFVITSWALLILIFCFVHLFGTTVKTTV